MLYIVFIDGGYGDHFLMHECWLRVVHIIMDVGKRDGLVSTMLVR